VPKSIDPEKAARSHLQVVDEAVAPSVPLMASDEGSSVEVVNPEGTGDVVLICEHAGNLVPRSLDNLGLDQETLSAHIAWDPGAAPVARLMADLLNAPLILQRFSRLVYDCNRPPDAESAMPAKSEIFDIPGNVDLTETARRMRTDAIYRPFRKAVASLLDQKMRIGTAPAVVTIHSFTPVYFGRKRQVELGFLHDIDTGLTDSMLEAATEWKDLAIRRNEPYGREDGVTHTLQVDAIARGLPNVMIEIRNDLIRTPDQQSAMATRLAALVCEGLRRLPAIEAPRDRGTAR